MSYCPDLSVGVFRSVEVPILECSDEIVFVGLIVSVAAVFQLHKAWPKQLTMFVQCIEYPMDQVEGPELGGD